MKIALKDVSHFKSLVIKNGYSQRSLGRMMEISAPYACQISNGTRNPGPSTAKKICNALNVEFDDIFFIEDGHKSEQINAHSF